MSRFGRCLSVPTGRPKPCLKLTAEEREELNGFAGSRSLPHALVSRAKLVLWSGDGLSNAEIAERLDWTGLPQQIQSSRSWLDSVHVFPRQNTGSDLSSHTRPSGNSSLCAWRLTIGVSWMDSRTCQTSTATPAKPGGLPLALNCHVVE